MAENNKDHGDELAVYRKCWESYGPLIVKDSGATPCASTISDSPHFDKVENSCITEAFENTINFFKIREWK